MKKLFALILAAMLLLSACTPAVQQTGETIALGDAGAIDFVTSQFKHITNGGVTEDENLPYNIDAITGATMTVEGPYRYQYPSVRPGTGKPQRRFLPGHLYGCQGNICLRGYGSLLSAAQYDRG